MHFDGFVIPFGEIRTILGVSEITIGKRHQQGKTNDKTVGDGYVPVRRHGTIDTSSVSNDSKSTIR
jgi:hypothetical protein